MKISGDNHNQALIHNSKSVAAEGGRRTEFPPSSSRSHTGSRQSLSSNYRCRNHNAPSSEASCDPARLSSALFPMIPWEEDKPPDATHLRLRRGCFRVSLTLISPNSCLIKLVLKGSHTESAWLSLTLNGNTF